MSNKSQKNSQVSHLKKNNSKSDPTSKSSLTKRRWLWLLIGCTATILVILGISLINSNFASQIGYPILIGTLAAILATLLSVAIVAIFLNPENKKE
jgi:FtsH-binding integral membrane protein